MRARCCRVYALSRVAGSEILVFSELSVERVNVAEVGLFKARRHRESILVLESDRLITLAADPTGSTRPTSYHHLISSFVAG